MYSGKKKPIVPKSISVDHNLCSDCAYIENDGSVKLICDKHHSIVDHWDDACEDFQEPDNA